MKTTGVCRRRPPARRRGTTLRAAAAAAAAAAVAAPVFVSNGGAILVPVADAFAFRLHRIGTSASAAAAPGRRSRTAPAEARSGSNSHGRTAPAASSSLAVRPETLASASASASVPVPPRGGIRLFGSRRSFSSSSSSPLGRGRGNNGLLSRSSSSPRTGATFLWAKKGAADEEEEEEEEWDEEEDGEWEYEYEYVYEDEEDGEGPDDEDEEGSEEVAFHDEVDEVYEDDEGGGYEEEEFELDEEEEVSVGTLEAEYEDLNGGDDDDDDSVAGVTAAAAAASAKVSGAKSDDDDEAAAAAPPPTLRDPDPDDDPSYVAQKELLDEEVPRLEYVSKYKEELLRSKVERPGMPGSWEKTYDDVFAEFLTAKEIQDAEKKAEAGTVTAEELTKAIGDEELERESDEMLEEAEGPDAFPPDGPGLESRGWTNADLVELDRASRRYFSLEKAMEEGTWEGLTKFDLIDTEEEWDRLNLTDPVQFEECETVLEEMDDDDRPTYHAEKMLLYDLDYDVYNLMLAACKHNPDAPVILPQWLYQLECYSKYRHVQDKGFRIDWEEADASDSSELERYWKGLGYDAVPVRSPQETNMIKIEPPDDEDYQIAHMQEWLKEVYDPKFDEVFFDDDNFMPYDSVFSDEFYNRDPPKDQVELEKLLTEFRTDAAEAGNLTDGEMEEMQRFMDGMVVMKNFTKRITHDSEEASDFRGHLVVACGESDEDLSAAEAVTLRFEREFGRQVFVETRVYKHAKAEDYLFEVWLEGFDIDLLHSKRRATFGSATWDGPPECDEKQIDYLVEEVKYLISDDHRYSYRIYEYEGIEEG